jgi:serine/threonine-protein kinase
VSINQQLQSSLAGFYTIERELSGGGMSRVFVAEELRLRRKVVVKALTPELAAGVSAERFEREIMLAAGLSHPSIVPLLTAGDAGGVPYYTMPFVEGESLRARLSAGGPIPSGESLSILRDVARALSYAHDHGVVHRDIKPENVLLTGDAALVTDFGIAKAISVARTEAGATLTQAGMVIGTPAYMAPEQVSGDPDVDFRADIYSFGCLAFELLTGESPFHGRSIQRMATAHLSERPPDVIARNPAVAPALAALVMQCLEKNPTRRPTSAREIVHSLDAVTTPGSGILPAPSTRSRALPVGAAVVVLAALAAVLLPRIRSPNGTESDAVRSLAVLPFANIGGDTADAYFADGMAEELATGLTQVRGLRVFSRSSVRQEADRELDVRAVGSALGVSAVLDGSVRRDGGRLRVTARLTDVADGHVLWSQSYAREVSDVFAIQEEITRTIVSALQEHFGLTRTQNVASGRGTRDLEAYDLYLRGQFLLKRRGPGVRLAAENFEKAISRDSNFARAHAGLSAALELFPYFVDVPPDSVFAAATGAAQRALALDSTLAEARTSLALAYQHAFQWDQAEVEYKQAVALDAGDAASRFQYGRFLLYLGRLDDAMRELREARRLDPYTAVHSSWLAYGYDLSGEPDSARAEAQRAIQLDSTNAPTIMLVSFVHLAAGDREIARTLSRRFPATIAWLGTRAYVDARLGDAGSARRITAELEKLPNRPWHSGMALAHAYLGLRDKERALAALERSTADRELWPGFWPVMDRMFDPVRNEPRFIEVVRRVGLDERALNRPR